MLVNSSVSAIGNPSVANVKVKVVVGVGIELVRDRVQCISKIQDQSLAILKNQFYF